MTNQEPNTVSIPAQVMQFAAVLVRHNVCTIQAMRDSFLLLETSQRQGNLNAIERGLKTLYETVRYYDVSDTSFLVMHHQLIAQIDQIAKIANEIGLRTDIDEISRKTIWLIQSACRQAKTPFTLVTAGHPVPQPTTAPGVKPRYNVSFLGKLFKRK